MNLLSNGQLALQVVVWLFSILLLLVYLFSYKRGKRLTIAGLSTFGFYLACIALFAIVTSAKSMLPSVNSGNASAPFNSNLAVFEKPSILPGTDKPFKLDWLTSQIQLLPTFNSNFDELNRSQVGQKWSKLLNTQEAVFTEFETVWREQHRFEVPMIMSEVLPGVEYFLFQTELLQLNLATGNVVSLWKGENNNEIATWYQQVWLTGSTIGGLVWGNNEQVHWLTTAADNTSTDKNYGATVHSIVVGSEPYRVEIDQPAQIALYIYDLQGIGKGFDFVTGQPFSGVAKQIPAPVTNEAKILAIVSPLHANLLAILFNDPLKVRFVMSSLAIGLGLSIGVAIYYRGRSYRWLKAGSVLLLGLPMLLALLAYYPKGNSHS